MEPIQMVDLKGQYKKIENEVNAAIKNVIGHATFINGPEVAQFADKLAKYLNVEHVITCANGTDALQIALMALNLKPGDEVIVPCFTYVATAEVIALLNLKPVLVDVDPKTFNITADIIKKAITSKTKAVVPVHLFGQCADIESIITLCKEQNIYVVEDTAQAIGSDYTFSDGRIMKAGTIGDIGCTSFFPSKNLGCYGDGGALYTNNTDLATKIRMIANHGQAKKYHHEIVGVNSRLDTLQAAILNIKLEHVDSYANARRNVAAYYNRHLTDISWLETPQQLPNSTHVYNQYTIKLKDASQRDRIREYLSNKNIPTMVYYPIALHLQKAFATPEYEIGDFPVSEDLCTRVLSLPIHTEMNEEQLAYIVSVIRSFNQ